MTDEELAEIEKRHEAEDEELGTDPDPSEFTPTAVGIHNDRRLLLVALKEARAEVKRLRPIVQDPGPNQEALARLRWKANRPVTLPTTARQRLELLARRVVRRPPLSSLIDHLYDKLRILAEAPPTIEGEARYQELLGRLRTLEAEDARRLREKLATTGPLKPGEVDAVLSEARDLMSHATEDQEETKPKTEA